MELSLPAAVVLGPSVAGFKRNLAKLTFSTFYVTLNNNVFTCAYYSPSIIA